MLTFRRFLFKFVLSFLLGLIFQNTFGQASYKATYYISEIKLHGSVDNLSDRGKRMTKQVAEKAKDVHYTLVANNTKSYFQLDEKLTAESDSPLDEMLFKMAKRFPSFNEKVSVNNSENSIVFVRNLINKDFVVKRKHIDFNWVIGTETKDILDFKATKAIGKYFDPLKNEELTVEAWFIPTIPLQAGPDIFGSLPGLIAEVNVKGAVVSLLKIQKVEDTVKIQEIDNSKALTQHEYEELIKSLNKKFVED